MWLPKEIVAAVDEVATVYYVNVDMTKRWNESRRENELRLLTGYGWQSKQNNTFRQGFKTITVAYRDAWYSLVQQTTAPRISKGKR